MVAIQGWLMFYIFDFFEFKKFGMIGVKLWKALITTWYIFFFAHQYKYIEDIQVFSINTGFIFMSGIEVNISQVAVAASFIPRDNNSI